MSKPKIIAFYLPQYHPTPNNDKWWGKGFTEWTNVGKAKPLFKGHYQPKVPADLGYYDLRLPEVREAQAELAKEAGIYGFCYYHYWFGNGHEELELPFNEVLKLGKPDFPFMLCWANESWHKKFWDKDGKGTSKQVLAEQTYPGEQDNINHFYRLLPAFKDPRYIKIDNKPVFMIYQPYYIPEIDKFIKLWNNLAKKEDLNGIYFITQIGFNINEHTIEELLNYGFQAIVTVRLFHDLKKNKLKRIIDKFKRILFNIPRIRNYEDLNRNIVNDIEEKEYIFPTLIPNWDHTPRSGKNGLVYLNSTPENFGKQIEIVFNKVMKKNNKFNFIFLKSWNEWGEGNYIEPDLKYGKQYIKILKKHIDTIK